MVGSGVSLWAILPPIRFCICAADQPILRIERTVGRGRGARARRAAARRRAALALLRGLARLLGVRALDGGLRVRQSQAVLAQVHQHGSHSAAIDVVELRHHLVVEALAQLLALLRVLDHAQRVLDLADQRASGARGAVDLALLLLGHAFDDGLLHVLGRVLVALAVEDVGRGLEAVHDVQHAHDPDEEACPLVVAEEDGPGESALEQGLDVRQGDRAVLDDVEVLDHEVGEAQARRRLEVALDVLEPLLLGSGLLQALHVLGVGELLVGRIVIVLPLRGIGEDVRIGQLSYVGVSCALDDSASSLSSYSY